MNSIFKTLLFISYLVLLSACSLFGDNKEKEPNPVMVSLTLSASEKLNPDIENRASPLVLRVYQLTHIDTFNNSDFFALYENDQALLAKEITFYQELEIQPGQSHTQTLEIKPNSQYIAVLAAFRNLDQAQWKSFLAIDSQAPHSINITLDSLSVQMSEQSVQSNE